MAVEFQTLAFRNLMMFVFFISVLRLAYSQGSPQNIEVFYPIETPSPSPEPISPIPSGTERLPDSPPPSSSNDNNSTIAKAVAATAASTLFIAGIFFFFVRKYVAVQHKIERCGDSFQGAQPSRPPADEFARVNGNIKGFIVDENGLDVLYWRQLQEVENNNGFHKEIWRSPKDEEGGMFREGSRRSRKVEPVQEIHLLRGKSSTSHVPLPAYDDSSENLGALPPPPSHGVVLKAVEKREAQVQSNFFPPASTQPPLVQPPHSLPIQNNNKSPAIPLPPPPNRRTPAPPPPPVPAKSPAPSPPPVPAKSPAPPPPPPNKSGGSATSLKASPAATDMSRRGKPGKSSGDAAMDENNHVKLKPLHWDKVNKNNADHSMVWDKINNGSFRFDDDLIEALFGHVPRSRNSPTSSISKTISSSSSKIMILDARKSQNIAIVIKSLALSREELLEALNEGQGLDADIVEKLIRIAPTEEEQSQILDFDGDPARLADSESFLYDILKAIPSAFTRLNAMQFRANYDLEILHMKECLQTLELGCKELRSQRMFMKLLEAILKAGNRMNAGTARGNAQAFNLTSLLKLSDVKSTDGKTTLLHFVVEEVVRSEGKKCFITRSHSLSRSSSTSSGSRSHNGNSNHSTSKDVRDKEYITLGLPVVGGLSAEFSNLKKAATVDINTFSGTCSALTARVAEIKRLVLQCMADGEGGFVQEMKGFIDDAEEDLKVIREEQNRVMDLVRKTKEYYQPGNAKDPLQVFVIVRDFLGMVDQVCVEIARNQQRRKPSAANYGSKSPNPQESRTKMKFPILPASFTTGKYRSNSSDTDVDS